MSGFIYMQTEANLWTVGHYSPVMSHENREPLSPGEMIFIPESDWPTPAEAAQRCHWLNGGEA